MESLQAPRPMEFTKQNIGEQWKRFKQRFEIYKLASGAAEKAQDLQVSLLLHVMGEDALDIFNSFTFANDDEKKNYDVVIEKFNQHFVPQQNVVVERFNFNRAYQEPDEDFDHFLTRIKNLAATCEFQDIKDSMIRDRIVAGISDNHTRERLLAKKDLTLTTASEMCQTSELAKQHLKTLNEDTREVASVKWKGRGQLSDTNNNQVDKRGQNSKDSKGQNKSKFPSFPKKRTKHKCNRCGTEHTSGRCPAYGKRCNKCHRLNHFAKYCMSKTVDAIEQSDQATGVTVGPESLYFDSVEISSNQTDQTETKSVPKDWIHPLVVQNKIIPFKLDTGAQANVLSYDDYKGMTRVKLHSANETLRSFTGDLVRHEGKCVLSVRSGHRETKAMFFVSKNSNTSLLGKDTCVKLGLIKLTCKVDTISSVRPSTQRLDDSTVFEKYPDVFEGLGCIPGEYNIEIDPSVTPVVHPCRKIPFKQHEALRNELLRMEEIGVVVKVNEPTEWVSSIVLANKPNGKVRVCLDPKDLNRAIKRHHYKLPTRDEIMAQFSNARVFSKLDASQGFWQMKLSKASSYLTTFNTPLGRYRYSRLPYGIKSAPEVYHKKIREMFQGLEGVDTSMDDIIVYGKNHEEHDKSLIAVLDRVKENNLKLNKDKCKIGVKELIFLGDKLTSDGLKPDPAKVSAIINMPCPKCKGDVQRFLGMVQYLGKWVPELAQKTTPLRELLHKQNTWEWTNRHDQAFSCIKEILTRQPVIAYYDPDKKIKISSDASKDGLGACLLQLHEDQWRPVAYASRSLIPAETRYAQIEKELLRIAFACSRFHQYIYGSTFIAETDHKPLIGIFKKSLNDCPLRIQRLLLTLQRYDMTLTYLPGKLLVTADTLSRATDPNRSSDQFSKSLDVELYVSSIVSTMPFTDSRLSEVRDQTKTDPVLCTLKQVILDGWPNSKAQCDPDIVPFWNVRDELSVASDIIFKGSKIVIPKGMRKSILAKIHEGHQGIEKCRKRGREVLYWPQINADIEQMVKNCSSCLKFSAQKQAEPLKPQEIPLRPFQKVSSDLFSCKGKDYMIITDNYSFYPEVLKLPNTCASSVIECHKTVFARHGTPDVLMTDNGPQYTATEFKTFSKSWDFQHITSSPHFPSSNGLAEVSVKVVKNILLKCHDRGDDFYKSLQAYRATPLDCGKSPAQLLFQRQIKTSLPVHHSLLKTEKGEDIVDVKVKDKEKLKSKYDSHTRSSTPFNQGAQVCIRNSCTGRWDTPARIVKEAAPRSYAVMTDSGSCVRRTSRHIKPMYSCRPATPVAPQCRTEERQWDNSKIQTENINQSETNAQDVTNLQSPDPQLSRKSIRAVKPPRRLIEEL